MTEDEMVGWHYRLNGYEFERAVGDSDGQGSLACCSPWGCKELHTTERLNWGTKISHATQCGQIFFKAFFNQICSGMRPRKSLGPISPVLL